jgi:hypothetical protein
MLDETRTTPKCAIAALMLAVCAGNTWASYGNMSLHPPFPVWLLIGFVLALPGALLMAVLEYLAAPTRRRLVLGLLVAALWIGCFFLVARGHLPKMNAAVRGIGLASCFAIPVVGTVMLLLLCPDSSDRRLASGVTTFGGIAAIVAIEYFGALHRTDSFLPLLLGAAAASFAGWHVGHRLGRRREWARFTSDAHSDKMADLPHCS